MIKQLLPHLRRSWEEKEHVLQIPKSLFTCIVFLVGVTFPLVALDKICVSQEDPFSGGVYQHLEILSHAGRLEI